MFGREIACGCVRQALTEAAAKATRHMSTEGSRSLASLRRSRARPSACCSLPYADVTTRDAAAHARRTTQRAPRLAISRAGSAATYASSISTLVSGCDSRPRRTSRAPPRSRAARGRAHQSTSGCAVLRKPRSFNAHSRPRSAAASRSSGADARRTISRARPAASPGDVGNATASRTSSLVVSLRAVVRNGRPCTSHSTARFSAPSARS